MIEAVIFDLGGVLLNLHGERAMACFGARLPQFDAATLKLRFESMLPTQARYEKGEMTTAAFVDAVRRHFDFDFETDWFHACWQDMFTPNTKMVQLLGQLARYYPCHLLSNTNALHMDYIYRHYPFFHHFRSQTLSFEVGLLKPDEAIYQLAAEYADTEITHCLFIDDRMENVIAARAAGMQAICFKNDEILMQALIQQGLKPEYVNAGALL